MRKPPVSMTVRNLILQVGWVLILGLSASAAPKVGGEVKLGYVYTDEKGNLGVYQPTYNLYDGVAVSVEGFRYQFANGIRLTADLKNITLDNRQFRAGVTRNGLFGLNLSGVQYRRTYNFAGRSSTRRDQFGGQVWLKPLRQVKLYGGYALTNKKGELVEWFNPGNLTTARATDYRHHRYHFGAQVNHLGGMVRAEYGQADFNDQLTGANDRQTRRYKVIAVTPLPKYRNVQLNGGFQHFENEIDTLERELSANTVWGGARLLINGGYSLKYSFIFDRAQNTGELVATDNITQAFYAGKTWVGRGAVTLGYRYKINDNYFDEAETRGYYATGWLRPISLLTLKGEFGSQKEEVLEGATLTGDEDLTRYSLAATYKCNRGGRLRLKYDNKQQKNSDIGSTADFRRLAADVVSPTCALGQVTGSYSLIQGDYQNRDSEFEFTDHLLGGSWSSPVYHQLQVGIEGSYYRSQRDLDSESFSLRLTGHYAFIEGYRLEVTYAVHNFDDLLVYDGYYTANIVGIYLSKNLSF